MVEDAYQKLGVAGASADVDAQVDPRSVGVEILTRRPVASGEARHKRISRNRRDRPLFITLMLVFRTEIFSSVAKMAI